MTPEAQRIAIAEACGWRTQNALLFGKYRPITEVIQPNRGVVYSIDGHDKPLSGYLSYGNIPDYLNDLNACHEMEKALNIDQEYSYGEHLRTMLGLVGPKGGHFTLNGFGCFKMARATAAQRCEAFLKTLGKWEPDAILSQRSKGEVG